MTDRLQQQYERSTRAVGGGVWFRNSDNVQVFVEVQFYPRKKLTLVEGEARTEITKHELERDYHRLRL